MSDIERMIFLLRGKRVILDSDIAAIYAVPTKQLKRQVRRNPSRFPPDFMIEVPATQMAEILRCQIGTLERGAYSKYGAFAFTEQGVAMLSTVLNSPKAIQANIAIMRAFVKMRELRAENRVILEKLDQLSARVGKHDIEIGKLIDIIRRDVLPPNRPGIGFEKEA